MSNCSNLAATSATAATATTTTTAEVSGIEETSLRASEVIQKFETASKSSSELNILSSHLMQDTVSSRLKKISAEEFSAMERKASTSKTATETALDARKELAEKKVSGVTFTNSSSLSTSESLAASSSTYFESSNTSQNIKEQKTSVAESSTISRLSRDKHNSVSKTNNVSNETSRDSNNQKTTMVVRLHPGQSRRLSAFMDYKDQSAGVNTKSWSGDIQCEDNPAAICGLEISFVSADIKDIDIKLIPVNQFCNINNPDVITGLNSS